MKKLKLAIFIILISLNLYSQVKEDWNLTIDSYKHNSSNYSSKEPPIETAILADLSIVALTQNGTFLKTDSIGNILWKKKFIPSTRQRIIADNNDNIILVKNEIVEKYNSDGILNWSKNYLKISKTKNLYFSAITFDRSNNIYISGYSLYSKSIIVFKLNSNGKILWKRKIKQNISSWHYLVPPIEILFFNNNVYILQHNYSSNISTINKLNSKGRNRQKYLFDCNIANIKASENNIFIVGNTESSKGDRIKIFKFDNNFSLKDSLSFELPRNVYYSKKALRGSSIYPTPTKEEYEKNHITYYRIQDFVIDENKNFIIAGTTGKQWLIKLDSKGKLIFNWTFNNQKYYNYNNFLTLHRQEISRVKVFKNKILLTGLSDESDDQEAIFKNNINLFLKLVKPFNTN